MRKRDEDHSSSESVSTNNTSNDGSSSASSPGQRRRSQQQQQQRGAVNSERSPSSNNKGKQQVVAPVAPRNSRPPQTPAPALAPTPTPSETRKELRKSLATAFADPKCTLVPVLAADVAFTRNQLRNAYLKLLFHAPFTQAAHGSEKALWVDTTYKVFDLYRARLANAEHVLAKVNRGEHTTTTGGTSTPPIAHAKRRAAFQECARIAAALRNFLSREDTFWKSLAERIAIVFKITEANAPLERAGISLTGPKIPIGPRAEVGDDNQPSGLARLPSTPADLDPALLQMAALPRHKQHLIDTMYNVIIYCGDIARYREQFRDTHTDMATSTRGSAASTPPRGPKRHQQPAQKARDYTTAILCYDGARLLLPSNGHASNQVAITASLQSDNLASVYHYYRSLCVKHPFQNAQQNLAHLLKKIAEAFILSNELDRIKRNAAVAIRPSLKRECPDLFVALQAWFFLHKKADDALVLSAHFCKLLEPAIINNLLPVDVLVRIVVTSIAASWWARLSRREAKESSSAEGGTSSRNTELNQLLFVLEVAQVLVRIVTEQQNGPHDDATAITRRVLPSLRILSKWLKSHLDYLLRNRDLCERQASERRQRRASSTSGNGIPPSADAPSVFVKAVDDFWASFVELVNTLRRVFPYESLPSLGNVGPTGAQALTLEEDIDLRGFIPTRRGMLSQDDGIGAIPDTTSTPRAHEQQLMRIADILIDAKVIAESEASPIAFDDESNTFGMAVDVERTRQERLAEQQAASAPRARRPSESTASIVESDATEDVVDLAMRVVQERSQRILQGDESMTTVGDGLDDEEDDEEDDDDDEILIPAMGGGRKGSGGQLGMQSVKQSLMADVQQHPHAQPQRTAQDLFLQMLNGTPSLPGTGTVTPSSPSASLHGLMPSPSPKRTSFGDIGSGRPSPSVGMAMNHHYQPSSRQLPHPLLGGNSIWGGWSGGGGEGVASGVWGGAGDSASSSNSFFAGGLGSAFQSPYFAPGAHQPEVWASQAQYSPQQQQQQQRQYMPDPWGAPPR